MATKDPFDLPYPKPVDFISTLPNTGTGATDAVKQLVKLQQQAQQIQQQGLRTQQSGFRDLVHTIADQQKAQLRAQRDAAKAVAKDPTLAIASLGLPSWESQKPQGFDQLPYSQQKPLYDVYLQSTQDAARQQLQATGMGKDDIDTAVDSIADNNSAPVKPARKRLELATDIARGLGAGAAGFGQSIANLATLGPNMVGDTLGQWAQSARDAESAVEQDAVKQRAYDDAQRKAHGGGVLREIGDTLGDLSVGQAADVIGSSILPAAVSGGAGAAARIAGSALPTAARIGTAAGALSEGVSSAGDAAQSAYQAVQAMPIDQLSKAPGWANALAENNGDAEAARKSLAINAFRLAAPVGAVVGVTGTAALPGVEKAAAKAASEIVGRRIIGDAAENAGERLTAGAVARAAAGETATEAAIEGTTQAAGNLGVATQTGDYGNLGEDVASNATLGGLFGGLVGGGLEGARYANQGARPAVNTTEGETAQPIEGLGGAAEPVSNQVIDGTEVVYRPEAPAGERWARGVSEEGADTSAADLLIEARNRQDQQAEAASEPAEEEQDADESNTPVTDQQEDQQEDQTAESTIAKDNAYLTELRAAFERRLQEQGPESEAVWGAVQQLSRDREAADLTDGAQTSVGAADAASYIATRKELHDAFDQAIKDVGGTRDVDIANTADPLLASAVQKATNGVVESNTRPWAKKYRAEAKKGGTVEPSIRALTKDNKASASVRHMAKFLVDAHEQTGTAWPKALLTPSEQNVNANAASGYYNPTAHAVSIESRAIAPTLLHEALHGLTFNGLQRLKRTGSPRAKHYESLIRSLYQQARAAGGSSTYALGSRGNVPKYRVEEMIAELSNPALLSVMATTEYKPPGQNTLAHKALQHIQETNSTPKQQTLLQTFAAAVRGILSAIAPSRKIPSTQTIADVLQQLAVASNRVGREESVIPSSKLEEAPASLDDPAMSVEALEKAQEVPTDIPQSATFDNAVIGNSGVAPTSAVRAVWGATKANKQSRTDALSHFKERFVERVFDHTEPFRKAVRSLETSARRKATILGALDLAGNRATQVTRHAFENYGGRPLFETLGKIAKAAGVNTETAWRDAGYYQTAKQALRRNAEMVKKAQAEDVAANAAAGQITQANAPAIAQAQADLQAAQRSVTMAERANDLAGRDAALNRVEDAQDRFDVAQGAVTKARLAAANARQTLQNLLLAVHDPRLDRGQAGKPHAAPIAGFNNAQANKIIARNTGKYGAKDLDAIAGNIRTLNGYRLTTDLESGRSSPVLIAAFLKRPLAEPLMKDFVAASKARNARNAAATQRYNDLKSQVVKALSNDYVPLTGRVDVDPEEFLPQGYRQPNIARDYAAEGRTTSLPDDGLTALWAAVNKSAKAYGWRPFQSSVAAAIDSMSEAQRANSGVTREPLTASAKGLPNDAIVNRRGRSVYAYAFPGHPEAVSALRGSNVVQVPAALTRMTEAFSYLATQFNLFFAPKSYFGDTWERIENLRAHDIKDAKGNKLDADTIARAAMRKFTSPTQSAAYVKAANTSARGKMDNSYEGRMLDELQSLGALSEYSQTFSANRPTLMKQLNRYKGLSGTAKREVSHFIQKWNESFERAQLLPVYTSLREAGVAPKDAAQHTLQTMDFGKRGAWMGMARVFYPFVQSSLTGGRNTAAILRTKKGVARLVAYSMAAVALQTALRSLAGDNEGGNRLDQIPESVRKSNLMIPVGDGFLKIRIGYGLPRIANSIALNLLGVANNHDTVAEALGASVRDFLPIFSPLDAPSIDPRENPTAFMLHMFGPPYLSGVFTVASNTTSYGTKVRNDKYWDDDQFKSEQGGDRIAPAYKDVAQSLRHWTGIDLAPEDVKAFMQTIPTGQIGQVWQAAVDDPALEVQGKSPPNRALAPVYTMLSPSALTVQFYQLRDKSDEIAKRINAGDTDLSDSEKLIVSWRKAWDDQDSKLRAEKRSITTSHLSEAAKQRRTEAYTKKRNDAMIKALVKYRIRAGLTTTGLQ